MWKHNINKRGLHGVYAIAAHKLGFDLTIIEKDQVYYEQAKKRLIEFQRQQVFFNYENFNSSGN